jgi:hypothetical protein
MPWAAPLMGVLYFKTCKQFVFILVTFGSHASPAVERSERTQTIRTPKPTAGTTGGFFLPRFHHSPCRTEHELRHLFKPR